MNNHMVFYWMPFPGIAVRAYSMLDLSASNSVRRRYLAMLGGSGMVEAGYMWRTVPRTMGIFCSHVFREVSPQATVRQFMFFCYSDL